MSWANEMSSVFDKCKEPANAKRAYAEIMYQLESLTFGDALRVVRMVSNVYEVFESQRLKRKYVNQQSLEGSFDD